MHGGWSSWSYGTCSKSCGGGTQRGTRSCSNPRPLNGGRNCGGSSVTTRQCNTHGCPGWCQNGWKYYKDMCYYFSSDKKTLTMADAINECQKLSLFSVPVSIRDKEEMEFISKNTGNALIWIGAVDIYTEGKWQWLNFFPWGYTAWGRGEPNNAKGDEDCAMGKLNYWNDAPCTYKLTAPLACSHPTTKCKRGWKSLYDRCYYFSRDKKTMTAYEAAAECRKLHSKAYLVSIGVKEEMEFISRNTGNAKIWIGAHDIASEGKWVWDDKREWGFTAWAPGEPNESNIDEDCVEGKLNWWNDLPCTHKLTAPLACVYKEEVWYLKGSSTTYHIMPGF